MKKGLIFATTLAMALGVGVAVGAHQSKATKVEAATNSVTLAGSFNGWSTTADPLTLSGDYWTIEKTFASEDTFKVVVNGSDWVGDGDGVTWCSGMGSEGKGQNFKVLTAGTYIIKAAKTIGDYGDKTYGISFEIPETPKEKPSEKTKSYYVYDKVNALGEFDNVNVYGFDPNEVYEDMVWPGSHEAVQKTKLGDFNMYQIAISESYSSLIMNNGTVQTADIDATGEEGQVLVINSSDPINAEWRDASWFTDVPAEEGYYLLGTATDWSFSGAPKLGEGDEDNLAKLLNYSATAGEKFKVVKYEDEDRHYYGNPEDDGDCEIGETGLVNVYLSKNGHVYVATVPDEPEVEGYYIKGSEIGWRYDTAVKMGAGTGENIAEYYGLVVEAGDKIRVCSYFTDRDPYDQWADVGDNFDPEDPKSIGYKDGDDFKFKIAGSYDIYAKHNEQGFKFFVSPHADRATVTVVAKQFAGSQYKGETSALAIDEVIIGQTYNVTAQIPEGYVSLGIFSDFDCKVPFVSGETLVEANMTLHIKCMELGYYLAGGEDKTFSVENSTKLSSTVSDKMVGAVLVPEGTSEDEPFVVKPLEFVSDSGEGKPGWASAYYELGGEKSYGFVFIDEKGNFAFTEPGTYSFYINYSNEVYFGTDEYAFHELFLLETGKHCDASGKESDLDSLKNTWAEMKDAFEALDEKFRDNIINVTFEGGDENSTDARLRMVARYHYIVWKYGSKAFEDFIFQSEEVIPPHHAYISGLDVFSASDNSTIIIIISIAAVSALAFTTLLLIKKRKQK